MWSKQNTISVLQLKVEWEEFSAACFTFPRSPKYKGLIFMHRVHLVLQNAPISVIFMNDRVVHLVKSVNAGLL